MDLGRQFQGECIICEDRVGEQYEPADRPDCGVLAGW